MSAAPPGEPRRFESAAVSVDVLARARRVALWAFVALTLTMVPLAFVVTPYLAFAALAGAVLWVVALCLPRLRWVGPAAGVIELRGALVAVTAGRRRSGPVEWRYAMEDVARAYRTDDEVRIETKLGETIAFGIDGAEAGERLLRALGQDARQRVLEVPLATIASRVPTATSIAWFVLVCQSPGLLTTPFALFFSLREPTIIPFALVYVACQLALFLGLAHVVRRRRVAIGMDGIVFRRFLRRRFYPYRTITSVTRGQGGVTLALASGRVVRLRTSPWWQRADLDDPARVLVERIESARADASSSHDVRAKLPLLERRGRAADEWRAHLASLVGSAGYRTGAVTARDLAAVIDDAGLDAEHRIAAAVALSASEPQEARTRARIAAAACADDDLRAALDHAAEGELDEPRLLRLAAKRA
jgi:hypothetical protein